MHLPIGFLLLCLSSIQTVLSKPTARSYDTHDYYVIHHNPNLVDSPSLVDVAKTLGVELVEQAGELQDHWLVRRLKPTDALQRRDDGQFDPVVETYRALRRQADSGIQARSEHARRFVDAVPYLERQTLRRRSKRAPPPEKPPSPTSARGVAARLGLQDPLFTEQWHLVNDEFPEHMMNVVPVWDMGITGKGVISSLVDDGLDYDSEDLAENFDRENSYDFNDHEELPTPKNYDDYHGTRCAGQVAAVRNNACGVGIAYNSKVAGVRILSGPISDVDEAAALNYGFHNVSIYSCSWGPPDKGQSMEGPGYLIKKAVVNGINNGRGGKGSIFVFASGNGAGFGDQCNFDGYTNSIYSVTVSAVDYKGMHPYYSESCAANMIAAYSSGSGKHIVTTDKNSRGKTQCSRVHGGTSAAAPNAVGVFALALEVRPDLTWRDIQHLCVETARMINKEDPDWDYIANDKRYSYKYGFGVLDAERFVKAAQDWKLVKPQAWFNTPTIQLENGTMNESKEYSGGTLIGADGVSSQIEITKDMLIENNFETLEHINVKVWINHTRRGDVEVELVSPGGIKSILASKRDSDAATTGFPGWTFMSVKHWGEDPIGNWTLTVFDQQKEDEHGRFLGWNMIFWGSTIDPSKAEKYEVPLVEDVLPPIVLPKVEPPKPSTTIQHSKPTEPPLPVSSEESSVEASTTPALSPTESAPASASASPTQNIPTIDQGWFPDMSKLIANQKWFFGAIGAVAVFGIGAVAFFWRRKLARRANTEYSALANDELSMTSVGPLTGHARTTRELYDAFGDVSSDEDDETAALRPGQTQPLGGQLGYHSGFLDDGEPSVGPTATTYRDEPNPEDAETPTQPPLPRSETATSTSTTAPASPSGSGSSWEHAHASS
ncbi:kex protein [Coprinopsis cinerea okayama7|uniref:Kex protein n=1 Tax=Coprinopsis cinerea (strain Okayama-7 / 130 / ATCC MYA-4618 / FGSC 9003) TaxID=240176 RepID=A8NF16_COPC7|nr:kex protein [Coprinopsis cinerea okayama7\|eukprot:XP_001833187.2 kex protein [Coprinopsis cinerea okayama7\